MPASMDDKFPHAEPDTLDWAALARMRAGFLGEPGHKGALADYWRSPSDLASYDRTFARRIAWKWTAVLDEARDRGLVVPPGATVLDWGCGTGVASREFVAAFGAEGLARVIVSDRSALATAFAETALHAAAPALRIERRDDRNLAGGADLPGPLVLLVSHVIGELDPAAERRLIDLASRAACVLWVEPGTPAHARRLVSAREALRPRLHVVAPCPHQGPCGLAGNERDWCHFFADPPPQVFHDRHWAEFARRMGVDLRALPTSFLVLARPEARASNAADDAIIPVGRVLGRPRMEKGLARFDLCTAANVSERRVLKRRDRALCQRLGEGGFRIEIDDPASIELDPNPRPR